MENGFDLDRIALERMIIRNQSILDSHAKGIPVATLALMTGLNEDYIGALIGAAGVKPPITEPQEPWVMFPRNRERNRTICDAYLAGERVEEIAAAHGLGKQAIYAILSRYNAARAHRQGRGRKSGEFDSRNKEICTLYLGGKTLEEVGQQFTITRERVRQILVKNGVEERYNGFFKPGRIEARQREVAWKQVAQDKRDAKKTERATARAMYDDNYTYEQIAADFGRSIGWVQQAIWATGGPNKNPDAGKPKKRLTPEARKEIGQRYSANERIATIAARFDVSPLSVGPIAKAQGFYRPGYGPGITACTVKKKNSAIVAQPAPV